MVTGARPRFYANQIAVEAGLSVALVDVSPGTAGRVHRFIPQTTPDAAESLDADHCEVLSAAGWTRVAVLPLGPVQRGFRGEELRPVDLSALPPGKYVLRHQGADSRPIQVEERALERRTLAAVLGYFRSQRSADRWDAQDHAVPFVGDRSGTVDVHGGWYDASGDTSKYLSHLSYANFMNPQQTPIVVWALSEHLEAGSAHHAPGIAEALRDEARHGAEFLLRMLDRDGYFYMTVFDQWSKKPEKRVICSYRGQKGELLPGYEAGYRQGGGAAIAALARSGRVLQRREFVDAALRAFHHLEENNLRYLDDGRENVIDDYCALLAATELLLAIGDADTKTDADTKITVRRALGRRADSLMGRIQTGAPHAGWLRADDGERPFFHAAEAGLPAMALLRAAEGLRALGEASEAERLEDAALTLLDFELWISGEAANPFGYARQYTQDVHGTRQRAFFIPHQNETGYWWQGENARLASLASAAGKAARVLERRAVRSEPKSREHDERVTALRRYAAAQLDWICGKNPFDACMLHGFGENGGNYLPEWPNVVGGISNGITSGFDDESGVDFGRTDVAGDHGWRWHEQWIPHAAWYLIAIGQLPPS